MRKKDLIRRCEVLRGDVLARKLATEDEIRDEYPERGKRASLEDWIMYFGNLIGFRRREDWFATKADEAEGKVLEAAREIPVRLPLLSGEEVWIYPKSFDALMWFREKAYVLNWIAGRMEILKDLADRGELEASMLPNPAEVLERASREVPYHLACLSAEACRKGVQLTDERDDPPEMFLDLPPLDVVRIQAKFQEVNGSRLLHLEELVRSYTPGSGDERGAGPMSWSVFFGTMAQETETDMEVLMRDRSLLAVLSQIRLSQAGKKRAEKEGAIRGS